MKTDYYHFAGSRCVSIDFIGCFVPEIACVEYIHCIPKKNWFEICINRVLQDPYNLQVTEKPFTSK